MKINIKEVTKISITDIKSLDPINVILEDFGPGQGRAIIECFGDAWSYYWGAMGNKDLVSFLLSCDADYLIRKFAPDVPQEISITDDDNMRKIMKKEIVERRKEVAFTKAQARNIWCEVDDACDTINNDDLMYMVFGNDWWECVPSEPNLKYEYLERIVKAVKSGLQEYKEKFQYAKSY